MNGSLLRIVSCLMLSGAVIGCAPAYRCPPGECYGGYRQSALRSADMGGAALGRAVGSGNPGRMNPFWAVAPFYDAWLDSFANSLVP